MLPLMVMAINTMVIIMMILLSIITVMVLPMIIPEPISELGVNLPNG